MRGWAFLYIAVFKYILPETNCCYLPVLPGGYAGCILPSALTPHSTGQLLPFISYENNKSTSFNRTLEILTSFLKMMLGLR